MTDANFNNEIGKKLTDVLEIQQDFIFEIGLTPNRTDAFVILEFVGY